MGIAIRAAKQEKDLSPSPPSTEVGATTLELLRQDLEELEHLEERLSRLSRPSPIRGDAVEHYTREARLYLGIAARLLRDRGELLERDNPAAARAVGNPFTQRTPGGAR